MFTKQDDERTDEKMIQTSRVRAGWSKVLLPYFLLAALGAATCLLYLSMPARPAQAQEVPDAGCPAPSDDRASVSARTAQTFTARNSGRLTSAQAVVANGNRTGASDDYVLTINEVDAAGVPTNTVLASALVRDAEVPDNNVLTMVTGNFTRPAEVEDGQEYALVVRGTGDFSSGIRTGEKCSGERYSSSSSTGPFAQNGAGEDLVFATLVDSFEPLTVNFPDDFADEKPGDGVCDVNSFLQGEQCTLRAAIQEANTTAFADTIKFGIGGSGVRTIKVGSTGLGGLPEITKPLTIDGYTQPGASPNSKTVGNDAKLLIELDGSVASSSDDGLRISAPDCVVKGLVINRFGEVAGGSGILVVGEAATNNKIRGNFIGTDPTGTASLGELAGEGVRVEGSGNTIGGTTPATRNVASGNDLGVLITGETDDSDNKVLGNFLGTDATGTRDLGNEVAGLLVGGGAFGNTVGGTQPGAANVISGNDGEGVLVSRDNNELLGNLIGTEKDGTTPLGNSGSGVSISASGSDDNTVGGAKPEAANTIAFNGGYGVTILESNGQIPGTGNRILRNSIFSNTGLGIDLGDDGVTADDFGDFDTGPNDLQNFAVLNSATTTGGSTTVGGTLRSADNKTFTLRFYSNPPNTSQGKTFLGKKSVTTSADGVSNFTFVSAQAVSTGRTITATATDPQGNTSEFSASREVVTL